MNARDPRLVRLAIASVGALIRWVAPHDVRRFGDEMRGTFADDARAEYADGGVAGLARATVHAVVDLILAAVRQPRRPPAAHAHTRKGPRMRTLWPDLRYAVRIYRRQPGFAAAALATLTLGIGANTAIFTFMNAALLRPLPYPDGGRLVRIWGTSNTASFKANVNPVDALDWARTGTFESLGLWTASTQAVTGAGEPISVRVAFVTSGFFKVVGVSAALGRLPGAEHDVAGRESEVVVTDGFWRRVLGADPQAIGRRVLVSDSACTIIGVLPRDFASPGIAAGLDPEIWRPYVTDPANGRGGHFMSAIGRLAPGVSIASAESQLDAVMERLAREFPSTNRTQRVALEPLHRAIAGEARPALLVLAAAVGVVLLIACANVSNLLLARATVRQREMALRGALGASRSRVVGMLLTESLLLSGLSGLAGAALGVAAIRSLPAWLTAEMPAVLATRVDVRVLAFTIALSIATSVLFGLVPALHATRTDLREALGSGVRAGAGGPRRLQSALLILETALAVVLLVAASLLFRSYARLQQVEPGFDAQRVLTFRVALPRTRYATPERRIEFFGELTRRLAAQPDIAAAGGVNMAPLQNRYSCDSFGLADRPAPPAGEEPCAEFRAATRDYFRAMGIPVLAGRSFDPTDSRTGAPVVVISQAMAERYWPAGNAIGQQFKWGDAAAEGPWRTVVGIVGNVRFFGLHADAPEEVYLPIEQSASGALTLAVRTTQDPAAVMPRIREAVRSLDAGLPIAEVFTTGELVDRSTATRRFRTALLVAFAALALGLAIVGVYGVMAFYVAHRSHEIGIRIALGASPGEVRRMVIGRGMSAAGAGAVLGLIAAFLVSRLLGDLLFGVLPSDAVAFTLAPVILLATALVASYLPARRATRVDPLVAIRLE